ncbi:MAG: hypothetical protein IT260_04060 [Saprospiraceae bacterium]|nr:hypothetical protein [Saprospiraceae bacterium]
MMHFYTQTFGLYLLLLLFSAGPLQAATLESAMSGNWNLSSTWVGGILPGAADDVVIKFNHNVTLSDTRSCAGLLVESGATFSLSGTLNHSGSFLNQGITQWSGGEFSGSGSITNDGTLNASGFTNHNTTANITNNAGKTINWTDGWFDQAGGGQTLYNNGIFNLIGNNPANLTCKMPIVNTGTINKTAGTLNIVQTLDNQAGGAVTLSAGATISFTTGNLTQNGTFTVHGTVELSGGAHSFGANFSGSGSLSINGATTVTAPGGFAPALPTINHSATLNAGAATALTIPNGSTWNWSSGDFGAFTSITNDGTLNASGFTNHNTAANITNNAGKTINWTDGWFDQAGGGQTLYNNGIFNLIGNNPANLTCKMPSVNTGTINKTAGTLNIVQTLDNQAGGAVTLSAGATISFTTGNLTQNGTFTVQGTVELSGGAHMFGANFSGSGTLSINGITTVTAPGGFAPALPTINHSALLNAGAATALTIPNGSTWNWSSGDFGAFTSITNDGTLNASGFTNHNTAANITNNAGKTINWTDGWFDQAGGGQTLSNNGIFNLIGNNPSNFSCLMPIVNAGVLKKSTGLLNFGQALDNQATGTIQGQGTLTFTNSLTNTGWIEPGLSTTGTLSINRTSGVPVHKLAIEVASNAGPGSGHDQLQSVNAVSIDGALTVSLTGGFTPAYGAVYTIMTYSSRSGTFSSVSPDCWTPNYGPTSTTITYEPDTWYADSDDDGFGDPSQTQLACTQPSGYVDNSDDCNDNNAAIHPNATETCNGMDDDCDGLTDDDDPSISGQTLWYADSDDDSFGAPAQTQLACSQPFGYVDNGDDCNDNNAAIHPNATETCNGFDDNCDGQTDDNGCANTISGYVWWSQDQTSGVKDVHVALSGDQTGSNTTLPDGAYTLTVSSGSNFTITPAKTLNKLNGVSTADALRIQLHVSNVSLITNPYQLVAADVNKSNSVSTLDATIINQALLGNPAANLQFKTSWRFVPAAHPMNNPPWGFPEKITLNGVPNGASAQNFYGIKTGDVIAVYANPANFSAPEPLVLECPDQVLVPGARLVAECSARPFSELAALQLALRFDPERLTLVSVQPLGALPLSEDHFGQYEVEDGILRLAWSQAQGVSLQQTSPLFRLEFEVREGGGRLSEALALADDRLPGRAYSSSFVESELQLQFAGTTGTAAPVATGLQLLQNRPNPAQGHTNIGFVLPEACVARLRLFDAAGRIVAERKDQFPVGRHDLRFDLSGCAGLLYYELTTPVGTLTRKMITVE